MECKVLVTFVKSDTGGLLFGSGGGAGVESVKKKMWEKAGEAIRAAGGMERDWHRIRKKWQDLCCRAKQYKNRREGKCVTGKYRLFKGILRDVNAK